VIVRPRQRTGYPDVLASSSAVSHRLAGFGLLLALVAICGAGAAAASPTTAPFSLAQLKPMVEPAGWKLLIPPSGSSLLWYPPFMQPVKGDPYSVSAHFKDASGVTLLYLNAGPKNGGEQMKGWPAFRIDHLREERNRQVHEESSASGVPFRGGKGTCVRDHYTTRLANYHYREISCFVQGGTEASVIVVAALVSAWPKYEAQIQRALEAWQVR
jgi:hypothetical protein